MDQSRLAICALVLNAAFVTSGYAQEGAIQDVSTMGFFEINAAPGFYELNNDGVPVLGFVTQRLQSDRVKFTMCNKKTIEVSFAQLVISKSTCLDPQKKPDIWQAGVKVVPLLKVNSNLSSTLAIFDKQKLNLTSLPPSLKKSVASARDGDLVGVVFAAKNGQKSLYIVTPAE